MRGQEEDQTFSDAQWPGHPGGTRHAPLGGRALPHFYQTHFLWKKISAMVVAKSSITMQTSSGWILPATFNSLSHSGTKRAGTALDSLPYKRQGSTHRPCSQLTSLFLLCQMLLFN